MPGEFLIARDLNMLMLHDPWHSLLDRLSLDSLSTPEVPGSAYRASPNPLWERDVEFAD